MNKKNNQFVYWSPRILSIIFVIFLSLMSLDVFESTSGFWETVLALFMHNIPALILLIILIISWKREIVGGIAFILAGLLYIGFIIRAIMQNGFEPYYLAWAIQIAGVAFFVGIMYLVGWKQKKKNNDAISK